MRNKKLYPENWVDTIRPAILKRDNYKCTKCGIKHRSYVLIDSAGNKTLISKEEHDEYKPFGAKTYRIYLQVCHLDNNKSNCDYNNLVSMCPPCHVERDRPHRQLMRLANQEKKKPSKDWIGGSIIGVRLIG
jgi:5-methylcytosine-specific restriction endonuclease McrA